MSWITSSSLAALLVLSACQPANPTLSPVEAEQVVAEVRIAFEALVDASKTLDADAYFRHFCRDGFSAMLDGTSILSFAEFERFYREQVTFLDAIVTLEFTVVEIRPIDRTTALLVNEYNETVRLTSGEVVQAAGGGSQLWIERADGWRLKHIAGGARHEPPSGN